MRRASSLELFPGNSQCALPTARAGTQKALPAGMQARDKARNHGNSMYHGRTTGTTGETRQRIGSASINGRLARNEAQQSGRIDRVHPRLLCSHRWRPLSRSVFNGLRRMDQAAAGITSAVLSCPAGALPSTAVNTAATSQSFSICKRKSARSTRPRTLLQPYLPEVRLTTAALQWNCSSSVEPVSAFTLEEPP